MSFPVQDPRHACTARTRPHDLEQLLQDTCRYATDILTGLNERSAMTALPLLPGREAIDIQALEAALKARYPLVRVFQNSAAYLGLPDKTPDFVHLTPENSRRLRALATWFALAAYGRDGHRDIVERNIAAAHLLGAQIESHPDLRLLAPVIMNTVCFTLADTPTQARVQALLQYISDSGEAFLTPTVLHGTWAIRAAFSNWRSTEQDVPRVYDAIRRALENF